MTPCLGANPIPVVEPTANKRELAPDPFQEIESSSAAGGAPAGDAAIKEEPVTLDQLRRFAAGGYLFALMDSTDEILVPHKAKQLGPSKAISLFSGTAKEQYWQVAPYLFQVDPELLEWTVAKLWKEPWGIFAITKATFEELRVHFKKFLLVQLPDGKVWFFRYYDPRILKAYLPVCEPWELQKFFGPIRAFAIAGGEEEKPTIVQGLAARPPRAPERQGLYWVIRPEQYEEFEIAARKPFEDKLVTHLTKFFPAVSKKLGSAGIRKAVADGIERAARYGLRTERQACKYLDLMFTLGPRFDKDPALPWVAEILNNRAVNAGTRIDRIFELAIKHRATR